MNTPSKITKWAALLLTVSGMAAAVPLNARAEHAVITSSTTESDKVYGNDSGNNVPLDISGSGVIYSGTRITVTSTYNTGIRVQGQGAAILSDVTVTSSGTRDYTYGILVRGTAALTAGNLQVSTVTDYGDAVIVSQSSTVNISNFAITTQGDNACGIYLLSANCIAHVTGGTISTSGFRSYGLVTSNTNNRWVVTDVTIHTSGFIVTGVSISRGYMELNNVTVNCTGLLDDAVNPTDAVTAGQDGQLVINNSQINSNANGLYGENDATIVVNNSLIVSTGTGAAIFVQGAADITVIGGTLATDGGNLGRTPWP